MGHVVAIFGPTASGKTDVAEALADRIGGEVVSADAMQVYRGLPILTNQPARPTRLVGVWPLSHEASVAEYAALAHEAIDEILAAGRTPVVAGGTGLYLRAALADLDVPPAPAPGARERWAALYDARGAEAAHAELAERDPAAAAACTRTTAAASSRALELAEAGVVAAPGAQPPVDGTTRATPRRSSASTCRRTCSSGASPSATGAWSSAGWRRRSTRARAGPISSTADTSTGCGRSPSSRSTRRSPRWTPQMRRYAAYQRKWMRRIPGLVTVDADRPAGEVADEILEVAGAREQYYLAEPGERRLTPERARELAADATASWRSWTRPPTRRAS